MATTTTATTNNNTARVARDIARRLCRSVRVVRRGQNFRLCVAQKGLVGLGASATIVVVSTTITTTTTTTTSVAVVNKDILWSCFSVRGELIHSTIVLVRTTAPVCAAHLRATAAAREGCARPPRVEWRRCTGCAAASGHKRRVLALGPPVSAQLRGGREPAHVSLQLVPRTRAAPGKGSERARG